MVRSTKERIEVSMMLAWKLDKHKHHEHWDVSSEPTTKQKQSLFKALCRQSNFSVGELTAKLLNGDLNGRKIQELICKERGCNDHQGIYRKIFNSKSKLDEVD